MLIYYVKQWIGIPLGLTSYDEELQTYITKALKEIDDTYTEEMVFSEMDEVTRYHVMCYVQKRVSMLTDGSPEGFVNESLVFELKDHFFEIKKAPVKAPDYIEALIEKYDMRNFNTDTTADN